MNCEFCSNKFVSTTSLKHHQRTAKYCLNIQGKKNKLYVCEYCSKDISTKNRLYTHYQTCDKYKAQNISNQYKEEINHLHEIVEQKEQTIQDQKKTIKDLQDKLENIAIKAVSRDFNDETIIEIDDTLSESQFTIYDSEDNSDSDSEDIDNYQLPTLEVGQGYTIEHREEDGYINVTNLCKAGGKQFKHWKRLQKTKAFLRVLSSTVHIRTVELIKHTTGGNGKRHTWVHPQVAINIAQWISPQFDVKVSGWVYEIMMTGKVDITNTTSYKKLQKENKNHQIKIQYMTKKYVKAQPRVQYEERNVVYILTTKRMKKDRVYILGKAINLTSRLSVYNKSDEHEVVFYASCGSEEKMSCVENMVFQCLSEYREQANRERFILPEEEKIDFFSDVINKSIKFFKK